MCRQIGPLYRPDNQLALQQALNSLKKKNSPSFHSLLSVRNSWIADMCHQAALLYPPGNLQALGHMSAQAQHMSLEPLDTEQALAVYKQLLAEVHMSL